MNPVILKSGIAVPCGKCDICKSDRRNEWSIRLAMHLKYQDRMPMFVTLTYDNDHLPMVDECGEYLHRRCWPSWNSYVEERCVNPSLYRMDVSYFFLKRYKRINNLKNDKFTYFGCGEYGDQFGRPHYHLLFFGDDELYRLYFEDEEKARQHVMEAWRMGNVHVGVAGYDGMHYVTKYCLKEGLEEIPECVTKPFTIASKNLGSAWFGSDECRRIQKKLLWLTENADKIYSTMPSYDFHDLDSVFRCIEYLEQYVPRFESILEDGRKVFLPRYFKRALVGQFEHFKDNPMWLYNHLCLIRDSIKYYDENGDYDQMHDVNASMVSLYNRLEKINKRLLEKKYNLKFKKK